MTIKENNKGIAEGLILIAIAVTVYLLRCALVSGDTFFVFLAAIPALAIPVLVWKRHRIMNS